VTIHWFGGYVSQHEVVRSVGSYERLQHFDDMRSFVEKLWRTGSSTPAIAAQLNEAGFRTPKRKCLFTRHMVRKLLDKWGLSEPMRPQIAAALALLEPSEWWLVDLARDLQIAVSTLARWCRKGWVHSRKLPGQCKWWVVWADAEERERLSRLSSQGRLHQTNYPADLKTPKAKPTQ
jgi:hypothetical protein